MSRTTVDWDYVSVTSINPNEAVTPEDFELKEVIVVSYNEYGEQIITREKKPQRKRSTVRLIRED